MESHVEIDTYLGLRWEIKSASTKKIRIDDWTWRSPCIVSFPGAKITIELYGNLWFPVDPTLQTGVDWEQFVIGRPKPTAVAASVSLRSRLGAFLPSPIKRLLRGRKPEKGNVVTDRFQ